MYHNSSENLQHYLWIRESNLNPGRRHPASHRFLFHERNFYKSITPRLTVQNVDKPHGYLRKFTPDGKLLLVFSQDRKSLHIYQYRGISRVAHFVRHQQSECIPAADHSLLSLLIRQKLFGSLFHLKFNVPIVKTPRSSRHFLSREFSIFVDNGHYVLLASSAGGSIFPNYLAYHQYSDLYDDTELYDYIFYLVDLRKGRVADTLKLEHDYVILAHHHGVSLYDRTLAILSTYRQCIELVKLNATEGKLQRLFTIGPYGNDLDRDRILTHQERTNYALDPGNTLPLSHLKQKILAFMYREVLDAKTAREKQQKLKEFYNNYEQVERMIILKMQLIDSDHILLRYEERLTPFEMLLSSAPQLNGHFKLYVFYNITQQKVLKIFPKNSVELLRILRSFCDEFRNVHSLHLPWNTVSPSNNYILRGAFDELLSSFTGGITEAAARYNPTFPISSQSFSTSPYLDYSLFSYNDHFISNSERPRRNSLEPIRFYGRDTGHLKFRVFLGLPCDPRREDFELICNSPDLVSFIFHPYEPFFISIQKFKPRYILNFHMYNACTKIKT